MPTDDADTGVSADADEDAPPEDAFALVGNEIRAEIIRTFGDARVRERSRPTLSFSDLRSAVDVEVRSSQFNYHLQELVGRFVERCEEGYRLRPEGYVLYKTLVAGTFDRRASRPPTEVGVDCYHCSTPVEAAVADGVVRVRCPGCDYLYDAITLPPGVVNEGEPDLDQAARYTHHRHLGTARGVCPTCGNGLGAEFLDPGETPFPGGERDEVAVLRACDHCGEQRYLSVGEALLADPGLVAFCHEHGVDVLSTPLWELPFAATDDAVAVRSREPWRVALTVRYGDDALELVVDGTLSVVERTRR